MPSRHVLTQHTVFFSSLTHMEWNCGPLCNAIAIAMCVQFCVEQKTISFSLHQPEQQQVFLFSFHSSEIMLRSCKHMWHNTKRDLPLCDLSFCRSMLTLNRFDRQNRLCKHQCCQVKLELFQIFCCWCLLFDCSVVCRHTKVQKKKYVIEWCGLNYTKTEKCLSYAHGTINNSHQQENEFILFLIVAHFDIILSCARTCVLAYA